MRTTKKIVSAVLAACMLASTAVVSSFAATADDSSAVQATTQETILTQRLLKILTLSMLIPAMILVLLTQKMLQHSRFGHRQQSVLSSISLQKVRMTSRVHLKLPATHLKKCSLTVSGTVFGRLHSSANGRIIITHTQSQQQTQHTSVQMQQRLMKHRMYTQRQQA